MSNIDYSQYQTPGVYISEIQAPVLNTVGVTPTVVALIGDSQRYRSYSEIVQLSGTTPVKLTQLGIASPSVKVADRYTGVTYNLTSDFSTVTGTGVDGTGSTPDDTLSLVRVNGGAIADGTYVTVTYNFTDPGYYSVQRFTDYDDIRTLYGNPLDNNGNVASPLSLAAFLAMSNGAREIVTVAINADGATPTTNEWATALALLNNEPGINVIVPVSGSQAVHDLVQTHVTTQSAVGNYRRTFLGRDGTGTTVTDTQLKAQANGYKNSRVALVSVPVVNFYAGSITGEIAIGGQYVAAAVAGRFAFEGVQIPLTRKSVRGFYSIPNQPDATKLTQMQQAGVLTLAQNRVGQITVRHGVTTDMSNIYTREISVQAAKDRLRELIQDALDGQGLIGSVITPTTPDYVIGAVQGALELATGGGLIFGYSNIKYRQPKTQPTQLEIRFMYKPSLPLNFIDVQFGIDTETGTVNFSDATTAA